MTEDLSETTALRRGTVMQPSPLVPELMICSPSLEPSRGYQWQGGCVRWSGFVWLFYLYVSSKHIMMYIICIYLFRIQNLFFWLLFLSHTRQTPPFLCFFLALECRHSDAVAGTLVPIRSVLAEIPGWKHLSSDLTWTNTCCSRCHLARSGMLRHVICAW